MTFEQKIARAWRMDEPTRRRHSNPWSVYTRFSMVPLLGIAFWSRTWLGWGALVPVAVVLLWAWFNPRVFPEPKSTRNWASKAVLGEWVWMNRKAVPVPDRHRRLPNLLSAAGGAGLALFVWGLWVLHIWLTLLGAVIILLSKLWFVDRMVWLYEDMQNATPEYQSWLY